MEFLTLIVFLRVLEYYDGILIITSNRVGTIDEAFKSRIQLALQYERLQEWQRRLIWENSIRRLESFSAPAPPSGASTFNSEDHTDDIGPQHLISQDRDLGVDTNNSGVRPHESPASTNLQILLPLPLPSCSIRNKYSSPKGAARCIPVNCSGISWPS